MVAIVGKAGTSGALSTRVIRGPNHTSAPLAWKIKNLVHLLPGWRILAAKALGVPTFYGTLKITHFKANGEVVDYGLVGVRCVTTAWCTFMVDQLQTDTTEIGDFKYHDSGMGTTDPVVGDTSMETVVTDNLRTVGSQTETSAVIYKSVGTIAYTGAHAMTEHGLFSNTRASGGTLLDRTEYAIINVASGDSIQFTYELTYTAGG